MVSIDRQVATPVRTSVAQPQPARGPRRAPSAFTTGVPRPFLKWAGGKAQLLPVFSKLYPAPGSFTRYIEPFVGAGAVFFHVLRLLRPKTVRLFDQNRELVTTYRAIAADVDTVVHLLEQHRARHNRDYYYGIRSMPTNALTPAETAARMIYLNKTCFNGLYRVNRQNLFNVPMGRQENRLHFNEALLRAVSGALSCAKIQVADFRTTARKVRAGDFVYFDPPYHPLSETAKFTAYTKGAFTEDDQKELAAIFRETADKGCHVMLSNSDTPFVRKLYRDFRIHAVKARRMINNRPEGRGPVGEVVVTNYQPGT